MVGDQGLLGRSHAGAGSEATGHLTFQGARDQYVGGAPQDIAGRIDLRMWEEDWRIMLLPGRLETQRALVLDYRSHFARFGTLSRSFRSDSRHG